MLNYKPHPEIEPSPAERMIMQHLDNLGVHYLREVVFNNNTFRYDFYLPKNNLIIEYDGKEYHSSKKAILKDEMKNNFARNNKIRIIRLQGLQYIKLLFTPHEGKLLNKKIVTVTDVKKFVDNKSNFKQFTPTPKKKKKYLKTLKNYRLPEQTKIPKQEKEKPIKFTPKPLVRFGKM